MSIEMENPQTLPELIDAAANYVAQIRIANMVGDCARLNRATDEAARLLSTALDKALESPSNITTISTPTTRPIPVQKVLDGARHLQDVIVLGWTEDGKEYSASSTASAAEMLLLIERTKIKLLSVDPEDHFVCENS